MTKKTILSFGLVASLFAAAPAQAQLLKSLKNTVKSTIQEATQKGKTEAEAEVKEQVAEKMEAAPSQEKYKFNWYLEDGKYQNVYDKTRYTPENVEHAQYSAYINSLKRFMHGDDQVWYEQLGESNKYIPMEELFLYPWTKAFVDDPTNVKTITNLARCLMFYNEPLSTTLRLESNSDGIISSSENQMLYWKNFDSYINELQERSYNVRQLLIETTDINIIAKCITDRHEHARKAFENPGDLEFPQLLNRLSFRYQARALKEQVLLKHPKYDPNADYVRDIKMLEAWFDKNGFQFTSYCKAITAEAKPVPKGVQLDAATMQKAVAAAKEIVGAANYIKVVPLSKEWKVFKNPNYPYQVMHRSIPCVIVYKQGEQKYWAEYDLKRIEGHNELSMMLGLFASPVPVKE